MDIEKKQALLLEQVREYQEKEHEKNRRRIKNGFLSMLIIPTVFLVILFLSDVIGTSKLIMLVIWIASMFLIAGYLIVVEYMDYKLLNMMREEDIAESAVLSGEEDIAESAVLSEQDEE